MLRLIGDDLPDVHGVGIDSSRTMLAKAGEALRRSTLRPPPPLHRVHAAREAALEGVLETNAVGAEHSRPGLPFRVGHTRVIGLLGPRFRRGGRFSSIAVLLAMDEKQPSVPRTGSVRLACVVTRLPEQIEGDRLLLRRWRPDDAEALEQAISESAEHLHPWMEWMSFPPHSVEERRMQLREWEQRWRAGGGCNYAVYEAGPIVGGCGLHRRIGDGAFELGYWTHVQSLRRGIATRVVRLLTSAAFSMEGIDRVEIHHDQANVVSAAVARRAGFTRIETRRDQASAPAEVGIEWIWRLTRGGWISRTT